MPNEEQAILLICMELQYNKSHMFGGRAIAWPASSTPDRRVLLRKDSVKDTKMW
jgi:hypothetical protein